MLTRRRDTHRVDATAVVAVDGLERQMLGSWGQRESVPVPESQCSENTLAERCGHLNWQNVRMRNALVISGKYSSLPAASGFVHPVNASRASEG